MNVGPRAPRRAPRAASSSTRRRRSTRSRRPRAKSRPCATRLPSSATRRASNEPGSNVPRMSQYSARRTHPLALALDDEPRRDRLHAAGGEPWHHLLPEDGRDLVAVEAVEDAPRLLRVDEPVVDRARLVERALDRVLRDLVEDHPPDGHLGLQHLDEVPGDRLALAVLVRREQELVGVREPLLQVGDDLLLVRDRRRSTARSRRRRRRRAPRTASAAPRGRPWRDPGGRGRGRRSTRRRSRSRGSPRWSAPSRATRR